MQNIAIGRPSTVLVGDLIVQIRPLNRAQTGEGHPARIALLSSNVDLILVTAREAADGGEVPESGWVGFPQTMLPVEYDIAGARFLGLASSGETTDDDPPWCRIELR